jgi:hypothetical protein
LNLGGYFFPLSPRCFDRLASPPANVPFSSIPTGIAHISVPVSFTKPFVFVDYFYTFADAFCLYWIDLSKNIGENKLEYFLK